MNKQIIKEVIILVSLGVMTSLSLPPLNFWFINFLTFTYFFIFLIEKSIQKKNKFYFFFYGWLFGFGFFVSNLYWISISLTFDENFKFLIPIALILIPAFLSLFYGLIAFIFILLKPRKIFSSFLIFSLVFGILEFVRGLVLTGFPWNLIAYSLSNQIKFLSITSIIGTYGLNLLCISFFTCPALFFFKKKRNGAVFFIFSLMIIMSSYMYGNLNEKKFNKIEKKYSYYKIRVIGSNISLDRFYNQVDTVSVINELIEISDPKSNEKTIFVWPEGILPNIYQDEVADYRSLFNERFNNNHLIIIGTNTQSFRNETKLYFNSFSLYDHELNLLDSYNKVNLVPFGEFLPIENILKKIGLRSLTNNYQSYSKGNERNIIQIDKPNSSLSILPLICYEIIYSGRLFTDYEFDLIVNISEDGWFGQSIGPKQHFVHSIFRAIESGKYVVRSSNNGIAGIINPLGIIEKSVEFGQSGYVDFENNKKIQPTIFSKYGNIIFGLLILLYIFLIFSFNKIKDE